MVAKAKWSPSQKHPRAVAPAAAAPAKKILNKLFALFVLGTAALNVGVQAQESATQTISVGESYTFDFEDADPINLILDDRGTVLIKIINTGRDSILSISDDAGQQVLRAAGWRGPEHYYHAIVDVEGPIQLSIEPDDPVSPPGSIGVLVETVAPSSPLVAAERSMTTGSNLNLAYYYGEEDTRVEALAAFNEAARLFAAEGERARQADALFEAANVSDVLCRRSETHEQLETAGAIWAEIGDQASLAASENLRGLVYRATGNGDVAIALFNAAAARREQLGQDYFLAESINNLGLVHRDDGDARLAAQFFMSALEIWQGDADFLSDEIASVDWSSLDRQPWMHHSLTAVNNLGWAREVFGDIQGTQDMWARALELTDFLSSNFTAATLNNNLGNLKRKSGEMQEAMRLLEEALAFFTDESPDEFWAARVYFNIGQLYRDLGDRTRARESFQQSLALRSPECDPVGRAETLREIAQIDIDEDRNAQALVLLMDAQQLLAPYPGNGVIEARLLELEGMAYASTGRTSEAIATFERAIRRYRLAGDRYGELTARTRRARANSDQGRHFAAIAELRTASELAEQVDSRMESFRVLTALGEVHLADGDPDLALEYAQRALELSEAVREQLVRPILLRDFASVQRSAYDVIVQAYITMGIDEHAEAAWMAYDAGRARRFSDVIRQSDVDFSLLSEDQQERYTFLMQAIAQRAEARTSLLKRNEQESADLVHRELLPMVDEMDLLHELARRPGTSTEESVSLAELQGTLSEGDVILEYYIGSSISGVWSISKDRLAFSKILNSDDLADIVDPVLSAIRRRQPEDLENAKKLSEVLLGGANIQSTTKSNLVIIPDGPLHYVPFSVLLDPATGFSETLIVNRNLSRLPSVRALMELRNRTRSRGEGIAIIADPVFQGDDPRVRQQRMPSGSQQLALIDRDLYRGAERIGLSGFPRLPGTHQEALAIERAAGDMRVLPLYGTDANREIVISGSLRPFRILHFATHGVLDDEEPALSGIVLSGVTPDGRRRRGFLRTQDIVGLSLNAELVVLSGCETGLGRAVAGEGLLGLSRAFFYAGAERVVSTLWQVPDQATAELMGRFYHALLQEGTSATEALRSAQLEIRSTERWRNPYFWAPFIIQGDWKGSRALDGAASRIADANREIR